ncbi:MAG: hypothetical protein AB7P08_00505 [Burkholderiales bacterium]
MAEPRDPRVRAAYRALPDETPSPELDAAIRAAARRAAGSRPGGARRWQVPISIAAVLALAIGVSLQVERERPLRIDEGAPPSAGSAEYPVPAAEPEQQAAPAKPAAPAPLLKESAPVRAEPPRAAPDAKRFAPDPPRPAEPARANVAPPPAASPPAAAMPSAPSASPMPAAAPRPSAVTMPSAAPPSAADAAAPARAAAPQPLGRAKSEAARESVSQEEKAVAGVAGAPDSPERQLERIAALRERGLHDEADRALAEFRRLHPDHPLTPEWRRRVERP